MNYSKQHLREAAEIVAKLDPALCEKAVDLLAAVRARGGRLFILGVGGSAANASHAVNDFRKLAGIEAYAPTDNVSELLAPTIMDGPQFSPNGLKEADSTKRTRCLCCR
jgi:D-sedoheptulose 7-phosphate isomerase